MIFTTVDILRHSRLFVGTSGRR